VVGTEGLNTLSMSPVRGKLDAEYQIQGITIFQ
jgi:hypothetical protein